MNYFKGQNYFKKGESFMAHEGSAAAVRRVLFRYVVQLFPSIFGLYPRVGLHI
jgi:hypothetical protein